MRIAQIAPLAESCPPKLYGGTERIVHFLTEELVRQGHEVTLFASGDSQTAAAPDLKNKNPFENPNFKTFWRPFWDHTSSGRTSPTQPAASQKFSNTVHVWQDLKNLTA